MRNSCFRLAFKCAVYGTSSKLTCWSPATSGTSSSDTNLLSVKESDVNTTLTLTVCQGNEVGMRAFRVLLNLFQVTGWAMTLCLLIAFTCKHDSQCYNLTTNKNLE